MKFKKYGRVLVFLAAVGLFAGAGGECPSDPNGNNNGNDNQNSNTGDPTQNVLNLTSAFMSARARAGDDGFESVISAIANPGEVDGINTVELALQLVRPDVLLALGVNSAGHLVVGYQSQIEVFATQESIEENTPTRTVDISGRLATVRTMVFDQDHASLYIVGENEDDEGVILVYDDTSVEAFDGDAAPSRTITAPILSTAIVFQHAYVSHDDQLYVHTFSVSGTLGETSNDTSIIAFKDASTLGVDGEPAAHDRVISFPEFLEDFSTWGPFAVDANDNLLVYAVQQIGDLGDPDLEMRWGIISVPGAGSLSGEVNGPDFVSRNFESAVLQIPYGMAVDSAGNVYFASGDSMAGEFGIGVYESVAGRTGTAAPDRFFDVQDLDAGQSLASAVIYLVD